MFGVEVVDDTNNIIIDDIVIVACLSSVVCEGSPHDFSSGRLACLALSCLARSGLDAVASPPTAAAIPSTAAAPYGCGDVIMLIFRFYNNDNVMTIFNLICRVTDRGQRGEVGGWTLTNICRVTDRGVCGGKCGRKCGIVGGWTLRIRKFHGAFGWFWGGFSWELCKNNPIHWTFGWLESGGGCFRTLRGGV